MAVYVCPEEIWRAFERNPDLGRPLIVAWLHTVDRQVGDEFIFPDGYFDIPADERPLLN